MPSRNAPTIDVPRPPQQRVKLDISVAVDTRVGRLPAGITCDKPVDDLSMEGLSHIKYIMLNAQPVAHAARIRNIICRAAGTVRLLSEIALIVQCHRHTRYIVPLFQQQERARRAVHAAAHRSENLFFHHNYLLSDKTTALLPKSRKAEPVCILIFYYQPPRRIISSMQCFAARRVSSLMVISSPASPFRTFSTSTSVVAFMFGQISCLLIG